MTPLPAFRPRAASQGNKKEELPTLLWSLGLAFPILIGIVYFVELQTFV